MTPSTSRRDPRSSTSGPLSTVRYTVNGVHFDMVRVPPGRFVDGEGPARRELLVSRPFELGVAPVTQALWRAVMGSGSSRSQEGDQPADKVSWEHAQQLMVALDSRGLPGFRLPTEVEWVWAARCGVPTWWAGAGRAEAVARVDSEDTAEVAALSGSAAGVFDLSGNVWEWMSDRYASEPLAGVGVQGPASGFNRVRRGGGWANDLQFARVTYRGCDVPAKRSASLGVRLFRTVS